MTGKQLKDSILQWAIQGKLVPQDPNDEPASILLETIREEKDCLVKEKKIKKPKTESIIFRGEDNSYYEKFSDGKVVCIDEEIPFEIPENWMWCRLGAIVTNRDAERIPLSVSVRSTQKNKIYDYYGPGGAFDKVDGYIFDKRLLLIGEDGANLITRSKPNAFFADGKYWVNNHVHVLDNYIVDSILLEYIKLRINGMSLADYITGTAQPKMNQDKMNSIPIPLPPLAEQHRIVEKVEEVLPFVDDYNKAQSKLDDLNIQLPDVLKKSILQEAIQGKLVPQCPDDEPASVLLQRIHKEKQQLVKEGKLKKKDLETSPISPDEIPFEIPDSWQWCRIKEVCSMQAGKNITASNIHSDRSKEYCYRCVGGNGLRGYVSSYNNEGNFAIVGRQGALCGCLNIENGKFYATEHAVVVDTHKILSAVFMYYFLTALNLNQYATATAQPGLSVSNVIEKLFPLPPLAEQRRIVQKIEDIFKILK